MSAPDGSCFRGRRSCATEPPMNHVGPFRASARGARSAGFRHRRGLQLRPRPRRADPALGRRGRPADAGLHLPTPRARSLAAGETFYTYQRGMPELRAALARYHERQFGRELRARALLRDRRRHAGDPDRHRRDRRGRRRGDRADAGLAEFRRRRRDRRRAAGRACRSLSTATRWTLDLDRLFARR